ncbi:MAG: lipoprotein insertase outer membrane protein LolB [Steroidobacteraceae bacterium]|jgi:outer membrane lipoprotein LolB
MRRPLLILLCLAVLAGCVTSPRPAPPPATPWAERLAVLQQANTWQLDGRAAVAMGSQGWQANLIWQQSAEDSEVHLTGPFGAGSLALRLTPQGLWLNGAPPSDAVLAQVRERLGFDPPLMHLRYWLLGVPDPDGQCSVVRNAADRAQTLSQAGWNIAYERYAPVGEDLLPDRLVLTAEGVRVRIVVDHRAGP